MSPSIQALIQSFYTSGVAPSTHILQGALSLNLVLALYLAPAACCHRAANHALSTCCRQQASSDPADRQLLRCHLQAATAGVDSPEPAGWGTAGHLQSLHAPPHSICSSQCSLQPAGVRPLSVRTQQSCCVCRTAASLRQVTFQIPSTEAAGCLAGLSTLLCDGQHPPAGLCSTAHSLQAIAWVSALHLGLAWLPAVPQHHQLAC